LLLDHLTPGDARSSAIKTRGAINKANGRDGLDGAVPKMSHGFFCHVNGTIASDKIALVDHP
jgi:hypothetical protein